MKFEESEPTFNLKLSLQEAIDLWHIVNASELTCAKRFIDGLHDFAAKSNSYSDYLE